MANEIMTMGEIIVEIMRDGVEKPLDKAETFKGPYPSGAPAIFIDTVARLGHKAAIVGGVGDDDFGKCLLDRLEGDGVDCSNIIKNDSRKYVKQIHHTIIDDKRDFVIVRFEEKEN